MLRRSVSRSVLLSSLICGLLLLSAGCGSKHNVGQVSGLITLDGNPLPNAAVSFKPEEGRASIGRTDKDGRYSLNYVRGTTGALIGKHKVTVSTEDPGSPSTNPDEEDIPPTPELLGPQYTEMEQAILTAEVKSGSNEFNFNLTSDE